MLVYLQNNYKGDTGLEAFSDIASAASADYKQSSIAMLAGDNDLAILLADPEFWRSIVSPVLHYLAAHLPDWIGDSVTAIALSKLITGRRERASSKLIERKLEEVQTRLDNVISATHPMQRDRYWIGYVDGRTGMLSSNEPRSSTDYFIEKNQASAGSLASTYALLGALSEERRDDVLIDAIQKIRSALLEAAERASAAQRDESDEG